MSWRIPAALLGAIAALGVAFLAVDGHRESRIAKGSASLDAAAQSLLFECRWERPTFGGPVRDCNGREALHSSVRSLFSDAPVGMIADARLGEALASGRAPPSIESFLSAHTDQLVAVRDSTRCSWACERGEAHEDYRRGSSHDAMRLLLLQARTAFPDVCLATTLDVLRSIEDGVTGVSSISLGSKTVTDLMSETLRGLVQCAARADGAMLDRAARDARLLAEAPPPLGDALALGALTSAASLLTAAANPRHIGAENVSWIQRGYVLDAAEALAAGIKPLRAYSASDLPSLFDRLERDLPPPLWVPFGGRKSSGYSPSASEMVESGAVVLRTTLRESALLSRRLRMVALFLAGARDHATAGVWSTSGPPERDAPLLRDPITGAPLVWRATSAGATVIAVEAPGIPAEEMSSAATPAR